MNYMQQPQPPAGYGYQTPQDTVPSCRQLMSQPIQFSQHYIAPTPGVPGVPPAIQQILPMIAIEAGNYLSANSMSNPVYVFYFNVVSQAGYRNSFWENAMTFAANYAWLAAANRWFGSDREIVMHAAEDTIKMMAAATAVENRQIQAFVDPNLWQNCLELTQRLSSVAQQFGALAQQQNTLMSPQNQGGFQQGGFQQGGYQPQPVQPLAWVNTALPTVAPNTVATDPMGGGSTVYRHRQVAPSTEQPRVIKYMNVPGEEPKASGVIMSEKVIDVTPIVRGMVMTPDKGILIEEPVATGAEWRPLPYQLYVPAYDTNHQKLELISTAVAGLVGNRLIYIVKSKGVEEMDRAAHTIGIAKGMYREANNTDKPRVLNVIDDLELTAKVIEVTRNGEDDETTDYYKNLKLVSMETEIVAKDSLIGFLDAARIVRIQIQPDTFSAFTTSGTVIKRFITKQRFDATFDLIGVLHTLKEVAFLLKQQLDSEKTTEMASLVGKIDRYITTELLFMIRHRLGLTDFHFDSFLDDIDDVFEVIRSDFGDLYYASLVKYQRTFIESLFGAEVIVHMQPDEADNFHCVTSEPAMTITMLDVDSEEFGIDTSTDRACEVHSTNFPGLYEFIKAITMTQPAALHHYVVTDDDVVFEVHQSLVGKDVFVIGKGPSL